MSTPNFRSMEHFGLFIQSFEAMSLEDYQKECFEESYRYPEWKAALDWRKDKILQEAYEADMEVQQYIFYEDIVDGADGFKDVMEALNDSLTFFEIDFKNGYYTGIQLYVSLKSENPKELDNEDCRYYFDECRSKCIRKYEAEIRKINKWLEKTATEYGWQQLICLGIFSNGEAIYQYKDGVEKKVKHSA